MHAFKNMLQLLRPLGLYRLDGTTLVDAELAAYGAGLALLWEQAEKVEQNCLPQSMTAAALTRWESLCGFSSGALPLQERRGRLMAWLSVLPADMTLQKLQEDFEKLGARVVLEELPGEQKVLLTLLDPPAEEAERETLLALPRRLYPVHLVVEEK